MNRIGPPRGRSPFRAPTRAVEDTMLRALAVLRFVVLANSIGLYAYNADRYTRPALGAWVMVFLGLWTVFAVWAYDDPRRRRWQLLVADLAIALGTIALTPVVKPEPIDATLPGFWVMGPVLAWAVHYRWVGGLIAAASVAAIDLWVKTTITQSTYGTTFLLVIGGPIIGFLSGLLQQMAEQRDRAERAAAAAVERQRIGRVVHDGVLQVLALVQKRGLEIGGDAAELSRLAGEQEASLRSFVQHDAEPDLDLAGELDLGAELGRQGGAQVSVAVPPQPVLLPARTAHEICAVVAACLSNVRHHVGRDAPAWVLLEADRERVVVSVRDDGPGIPEGRIEEAQQEGRLGVLQSICGRIEDLGGRATLTTAPGEGTEWEFSVPR